MQIVCRQDPAVNRRTSCEHAWRYWKCATLTVKQVVLTVEVNMLKIQEDRGVNQVRKSRNPSDEEAQDRAENENPTAYHVIKQIEIPQIGDS